jgi:hypothetical protein
MARARIGGIHARQPRGRRPPAKMMYRRPPYVRVLARDVNRPAVTAARRRPYRGLAQASRAARVRGHRFKPCLDLNDQAFVLMSVACAV